MMRIVIICCGILLLLNSCVFAIIQPTPKALLFQWSHSTFSSDQLCDPMCIKDDTAKFTIYLVELRKNPCHTEEPIVDEYVIVGNTFAIIPWDKYSGKKMKATVVYTDGSGVDSNPSNQLIVEE